MKIHVTGRPDKISLKLIKEAINFYSDCLLSQRLKENIELKVEFSDLHKEEKIFGDCGPDHFDDYFPRDFIMRIDADQSSSKILRTIAHEITHLAQYAQGTLKDYVRTDKTRWDGEIYNYGNDNETLAQYYLAPWEVEASGYENNLYRLFVLTKKRKKQIS